MDLKAYFVHLCAIGIVKKESPIINVLIVIQ